MSSARMWHSGCTSLFWKDLQRTGRRLQRRPQPFETSTSFGTVPQLFWIQLIAEPKLYYWVLFGIRWRRMINWKNCSSTKWKQAKQYVWQEMITLLRRIFKTFCIGLLFGYTKTYRCGGSWPVRLANGRQARFQERLKKTISTSAS